jgi:two-component system response regulator AtoC
MKNSVLLVDDERVFRVLAEEALASEGFEVTSAATLARGRAALAEETPDVVLLDRRLPDGDGIELLQALKNEGPAAPPVIVITAYGDIENAVEALKAGAWDYLTKPIQVTDLVVTLRKAVDARRLHDRLNLARSSAIRLPFVESRSRSKRDMHDLLRRVGDSPLTPVFLSGPSGAGKQYAAEMLHKLTYQQQDAPFVEVNCAALPGEMVESELFGHEKGAFTDARHTRRGLVELADGGTLFLDEVIELPERSQAKLLKFLDTFRLRRLGGQREIEVALRIIVATNHEVSRLLESGRMRNDLYHRLMVFHVTVPPLAAAPEDIPDLARAFVSFFSGRVKKRVLGISEGALAKLTSYHYPGNVRELRNIIERAVILATGEQITEADIVIPAVQPITSSFFAIGLGPDGKPPRLADVERAYVARVVEQAGGHRTAAAEALDISYPTLLKYLRSIGIDEA